MPKTKTKKSQKPVHKKFVSGILAALAFTIVVGSQLGNVEDPAQLAAALMCANGTAPDANNVCSDGSTPMEQQAPPPEGNQTPPPQPTNTNVVCPDGSSHPSPYTCPATSGTTNTGTQPGTTCSSGQWWDSATNSCKSSTYTNPDPNTPYPAGTQNWPTKQVMWNSLGLQSMVCENAPQAEIDARKLIVKDLTQNQISWPNPTDCTRTDKRAGFPEKGTSTNNYPNYTDGNTGAVDTVGACQGRGGQWYASSSTCSVPSGGSYGTQMPGDQYGTYPMSGGSEAERQAQCVATKGTWNAAIGTASGWCKPSMDQGMQTQPYQPQPYGDYQFGTVQKDPAYFGRMGDSAGCTSSGYKWDSRVKDCFPAGGGYFDPFAGQNQGPQAGQPYYPDFASTNFNDQYKNSGNSFNFDYNKAFGEYQLDFTATDSNRQFGEGEVRRFKQDGQRAKSEYEQVKKEFDRVVKRAGGNTSCPAIAKAQAALTSVESAVNILNSATADTAGQAQSVQEQLYGGPYGQEGVMQKAQQAVGMSNMCEGFSSIQKDIKRQAEQWTREIKRIADANVKAQAQAVITKLSAIDPSSLADWSCMENQGPAVGGSFCDPMRPVFEAMDDLRWEFGDIMGSQKFAMEEQGVCGNLENIKAHLSGEVESGTKIPEALMKKASGYLNTGVQACKAGKIDEAARTLGDLERLKGEFQRYISLPEDGEDDAFGKLDARSLMRDSLNLSEDGIDIEALVKKIEDRLLSKMQNAIQVALDEQAKRFTTVIAQLETKLAEAIALKVSAVTDNIIIGFEGEKKDQILEIKTELSEVVTDLDRVTSDYEDDLSRDTENAMEEIFEYATVRNWTEDGASVAKKEIDAFTNAVAAASSDEDAKEIIEEEAPQILAALVKAYDDDKDAQLSDGTLAFADLHGQEGEWFSGYATAAKTAGILNGEANADGTRSVNAGRSTNVAEGIVMLGRQVAGGADNIPTFVDLSNPVVARMPNWAQPAATYLANSGVDLSFVGNKRADEAMTRGEMMQGAADAFGLVAGDTAAVRQNFPDTAGVDPKVLAGAAALVDAGVVKGEANGSLNTGGDLNRAAFAKIMIEAGRAAGDAAITGPQS